MPKANSVVIYRGPSELDGAPIVVVLSGLVRGSSNAKTGPILQTYILRSDFDPVHVVREGMDGSITGDCPRRSDRGFVGRSCYVNIGQGPLAVYRGLASMPDHARKRLRILAGTGRVVRLGTYGDPAAVPLYVWTDLLSKAKSWTGYTHQWRTALGLQPYCMASADSLADAVEAQKMGWRTFRVRSASQPLMARESICPASAEAGKILDCAACLSCGGAGRRGSIAIIAHGATPAMRAA